MPQPRLPPMDVLLLVSLMAGLNLPLIFTAFTGMDQYGFFTLGLAAKWPLALAAAANVAAVSRFDNFPGLIFRRTETLPGLSRENQP